MALQIFLDCDGVLADFDGRAEQIIGMSSREYEKLHGPGRFWSKIYSQYDFFLSLDVLPGATRLVQAVQSYGIEPKILTGLPSGGLAQARDQKLQWGATHFPGIEMITCMSKDKCKYASPGDILIDDWEKWRHKWEEVGGKWITHDYDDVERTLTELNEHMELLRT